MEIYLDQIRSIISQSLREKIKTFENLDSNILMNEGASHESIAKCENYFKNRIPIDYKKFLKNYDGGTLFQIEDFAGFKFLSTGEIVKHNSFQKENFGHDWNDDFILFCLCIGDAEYLGFKILDFEVYEIVYCIMDELPNTWQTIDTSFSNFVSKLIEEKGKKFWLDF